MLDKYVNLFNFGGNFLNKFLLNSSSCSSSIFGFEIRRGKLFVLISVLAFKIKVFIGISSKIFKPSNGLKIYS